MCANGSGFHPILTFRIKQTYQIVISYPSSGDIILYQARYQNQKDEKETFVAALKDVFSFVDNVMTNLLLTTFFNVHIALVKTVFSHFHDIKSICMGNVEHVF